MNLDLNALRTFVLVVDAGGVTEAARRAGLPKSTVSRHVRDLESRLGERLLERRGRGVAPTGAGRRLHESALRHGDRVALITADTTFTYRELDERTDRVAAALAGLGLRRLDPVVFQVTNKAQTVVAWYGWLAFGVRWLHVITGIAWIGSSFYFIALDLGLKKVPHLLEVVE